MESFTHYYHYDENGRLIDYERVYDEPSHLKARGYYIYGDDIDEWNAIGVKSIYTVGDKSRETRESEIFWYQLKPTAITSIDNNDVVETNYYDLQGRKVTTNATGLLIKQMRMQDGTTKSIKVLR